MRGIVVVDQPVDDRVVGWHVNVGDGLESTMAGAWVLPSDDPRIARLLTGRILVTTEKARRCASAPVPASPRWPSRSSPRPARWTPPSPRTWPRSRRPSAAWSPRAGRGSPPGPVAETAGDPLASNALTLARWVSDLLTAWDRIEKERLSRPFLAVRGGELARPLPPGWPTASAVQLAA